MVSCEEPGCQPHWHCPPLKACYVAYPDRFVRQQTLQIITAAEANGHARLAEMNRQVAGNLDGIIAALEADSGEEKEAAAGAS